MTDVTLRGQRIEARRIPGTGQIAYREWWGIAWTDWQVVDAPYFWSDGEPPTLPTPPAGLMPPLPTYWTDQPPCEIAHRLKIDPGPLHHIELGVKRFEWRGNDRHYAPGMVLELREQGFRAGGERFWTGHAVLVRVLYVMTEGYGLPLGFNVLSIEPIAIAATYPEYSE